MANPFSGLENIGQSYLAGVQLANQRQAREDALAQRQEEARIRQDYYNQLGQERQAALEERRRARLDQAAAQFGQDLVLNTQGEPDYATSAQNRDRRLQQEQVTGAEAELAGMYGTQPPLSPEIVQSPAFRAGMLRGTAKRLAQEKDITTALIRRGFMPADEIPTAVEDQIQGLSAPDIFGGAAPMAAPAPGAPRLRMAGREFIPPALKPTPAPKPVTAGKLKIVTPEGEMTVNLTPEMVAERMAKKDVEPSITDDIEAARKQLQSLQDKGIEDFNLTRDKEGNLKVVEDTAFSIGRSADEIMADLTLEARKRGERRGERTAPAAAPKGTNRVIPISAIPRLPPLRVQ